jgi:hypothetical protein
MYQPLIDAMNTYFQAGIQMDLEKMDQLYASDFENLRMDTLGNLLTLTKEQFMQRFRALQAQGQSLESTEDVEFLGTTLYDHLGTIVIRRVKEGKPVLYNFVWRLENGTPTTLVREFTIDQDISYLMQLVKQASAQQ